MLTALQPIWKKEVVYWRVLKHEMFFFVLYVDCFETASRLNKNHGCDSMD